MNIHSALMTDLVREHEQHMRDNAANWTRYVTSRRRARRRYAHE